MRKLFVMAILVLSIFSVNNYIVEKDLYDTVISIKGEEIKVIYDPKIDGLKSLFENKILGIYLVKIYPLFFGLTFSSPSPLLYLLDALS